MRFSGEQAHQIATGRISVVIRPLSQAPPKKPHQSILSYRRPNQQTDPEYLWKRAQVKQEHGYALISSTRKRVDEITLTEAQAAGHQSLKLLREWFEAEVGPWRDEREVYVVSFRLVERPRYVNALSGAMPRFDQVDDYTTSPSKSVEHGIEAVSDSWQQRFSDESERERVQRRAREQLDRQLLSTEERMQRARGEARRRGVDITRQENRLLDALKKHDRGRALASIESLERKLQSRAA